MFRLAILLLLFFVLSNAEKASDKAFRSLIAASERANGEPIKLSHASFQKWVSASPRNYTFAITLTTLSGQFACPHCPTQFREFTLLSRSYLASLPSKKYRSKEFYKKPLFFGVLDYSEQTMNDFRLFLMQDIPHFAVVRPQGQVSSDFKVEPQHQGKVVSADEMNRFLSAARFRFKLMRPLWPELVKWLTVFVVGTVVFTFVIPQMWKHRKSAFFPFAAAISVFFVSMSGLVYNLIRTPPFFSQNPYTGEMVLFDTSGRGQFVLEGLVAASLMTVSAVLFILISCLGELEWRSFGAIRYRLVFFSLFTLLCIALSSLFQVYLVKYAWYPYKFPTVDFIGFLEAYIRGSK